MEKRNKLAWEGMVFLLALLFLLPFVSSANVGISPGNVYFNDVMRDGYAERYLVISVDSIAPVTVELSSRGEIEKWINFSETILNISKNEPYYLKISVHPPVDIPNGKYSGFLNVLTTSYPNQIDGHAVGKIHSSLDLAISVDVTDVEIVDCKAKNFEIFSAEKGDDILLKMDIENKGNVILNPKILADIWDQDQISVIQKEEFNPKGILPTMEETLEFRIKTNDLDLGQYWSEISIVQCLQEALLTFDVLEEGALKAKGLLLNILSKGFAEVGETISMEANFKNIGEKEISAKFEGKITLNGKIVQILESEEIDVSIGDVEIFNFYFTPEKPGKYVVSGRVYYDGKKTFESSTTIDVTGFDATPFVIMIYVIFLFIILMFIYKIRKQKKRYRRKLRNLR